MPAPSEPPRAPSESVPCPEAVAAAAAASPPWFSWIRDATPEDVPAMDRLLTESLPLPCPRELLELVAAPRRGEAFMRCRVLAPPAPAGLCGVSLLRYLPLSAASAAASASDEECELMALAVAASERGRGAGGALLADAEQLVRERGARLLRLHCQRTDARASGFYASRGFRLAAELDEYYPLPGAGASAALRLEKPLPAGD